MTQDTLTEKLILIQTTGVSEEMRDDLRSVGYSDDEIDNIQSDSEANEFFKKPKNKND